MSSSKTAYKVAIHNRFASLDSDGESEPIVKASPVEHTKAAPLTREPITNFAPTEGGFVGAGGRGRGRGPRVSREGNGDRGGRARRFGSPNDGAPASPRLTPASSGAAPGDDYSGPSGDEGSRPLRRRWYGAAAGGAAGTAGAPGRRFRSGVATGEQARKHGRDFDRHSGMRQRGGLKKLGAGGHNWGNARTDYEQLVGDGSAEETSGTKFDASPAELQLSPPGLGSSESPTAEGGDGSPGSARQQTTGHTAESGVPPVPGSAQQHGPQPHRPATIDFIQYQKSVRQRRANAPELLTVNLGATRAVDDSTLERDGYERYQREETEDERFLRELRDRDPSALTDDDEDDEKLLDDATLRPKTFNFFELTGEGNRRGRGGRGNRGRGGRYESAIPGSMEKRIITTPPPIHIDLRDSNAFPALG